MTKAKVKITIVAEIESGEYETTDAMLEELMSECDYSIPSTDCVEVLDTEFRDIELI